MDRETEKKICLYKHDGVPTLFLLDQEGVVVKKTAMVDELTEIFEGGQENS